MDTISVIIPTFNRAKLLARAVESVFAQESPCDEILVIDDGSQDDTKDVVQHLQRKAPVPLFYSYQRNRGAAAARNLGIQHAKGNLLAFLDSDDWWLAGKLGLQIAAMERHPDYLISHTQELWHRKGLRVNQKKKHHPPHGNIFFPSLRMCVVGMSTVIIRRKFFAKYGNFDETLLCCEDYDLWLRAGRQEPFLLIPHPLTGKEGGRDDQLSRIHRQGMDIYRIRSLSALLASETLSFPQKRAVIHELEYKCSIYAKGCIKHGRPHEGIEYFQLASRYLASLQEYI